MEKVCIGEVSHRWHRQWVGLVFVLDRWEEEKKKTRQEVTPMTHLMFDSQPYILNQGLTFNSIIHS